MTENFLTVKEAARETGKSPSSIRRIIYPILEDDQHADRHHIQPGVEEALQLRIKGESFPWRISEELLRREVPIGSTSEKGSADARLRSSSGEGYAELLTVLRRELDIKNQQITVQSEQISKQMQLFNEVIERLREGNILIASLQQRQSLTDGRDSPTDETEKKKPASSSKPEKGSARSGKSAKSKPRLRDLLFHKLF